MPFLHLAGCRSGSDRLLAAMNRRHNADEISRNRRARAAPVRFGASRRIHRRLPGESAADFAATLDSCARYALTRPLVQVFARVPAPPPRARRPGAGAGQGREDGGSAGVADGPAARIQRGLGRSRSRVLFEKAGRHEGQLGGRSHNDTKASTPRLIIDRIGEILPGDVRADGPTASPPSSSRRRRKFGRLLRRRSTGVSPGRARDPPTRSA